MNEYMTESLKKNNKQCQSTGEADVIALRGRGRGIVRGMDVKKFPVSQSVAPASQQWAVGSVRERGQT